MRQVLCGWLCCLVVASTTALSADDSLETVKKSIAAHGGKEKLSQFRAVILTGGGKVFTNDMELDYTAKWYFGYPDRFRIELSTTVNGQTIDVVQVYDGKEGWVKVGDNTVKLNEAQLKALKVQLQVGEVGRLVPLLNTKKYTVGPLGETDIRGQKCIGINVTGTDGTDVNLYFHPQTFYVVKQEYPTKDEKGNDVSQAAFLSGYKKFNGIAMPTKLEVQQNGKKFITAEFSEVELKEKLDDNLFQKPLTARTTGRFRQVPRIVDR